MGVAVGATAGASVTAEDSAFPSLAAGDGALTVRDVSEGSAARDSGVFVRLGAADVPRADERSAKSRGALGNATEIACFLRVTGGGASPIFMFSVTKYPTAASSRRTNTLGPRPGFPFLRWVCP